ncbi:MAG: AtpZ/AtpI family protein [Tepidisphaeraceae bacterium]
MPKEDQPDWGSLATAGLDVGVGVGLGVVIGVWIDRKFHCGPWATLIGTVLGLAGGIYLMIKELMRASRG